MSPGPALISQISNLEFVPRYLDIWIFAPPDGIPGLSQDQLGRGRSRQCDIYIISLLPSHNHHHHCPPKNKTRNINYNCLKSTLLLSLARHRRGSGPKSDLQNCPQTLHERFEEKNRHRRKMQIETLALYLVSVFSPHVATFLTNKTVYT